MRELVRDLLNSKLSRRGFVAAMVSAGYTTSAALSALQSVAAIASQKESKPGLTRVVEGTGGDLFTEQLIEAGARFVFVANGTGLGPFCDALVSRPQIQLIQAIHEGQTVAMASGYAMATGKPAFAMYHGVGTPNSTSNMYNAMKDRIPVVLFADGSGAEGEGLDGREDVDDWLETVKQFTKWRFVCHSGPRIPEFVRTATKLASVLPGGPTYVRIPTNLLAQKGIRGTVFSAKAFEVPMELPPDSKEVEKAARLLLDSTSPVMLVGSEVTQCGATGSVVKLAELLGIPVELAISHGTDFPNFHPLCLGKQRGGFRYPKKIDCYVGFGTHFPVPDRLPPGVPIVHVTVDSEGLGRNTALSASLLGNVNLTAKQLIDAIQSLATPQQIEARAATRRAECAAFTKAVRETRLKMARQASGEPVPWYRALYELNDLLDRDAVIVPEIASDEHVTNFMPFGDGEKLKIGRTEGWALGWGMGAAAGVKLALPNRQVVALQGDGGFLFGQTDSLWTLSRYDIPVLIVVLNNRSYQATRWRIMARGSAAGDARRDYISYLGDPDVDFTKLADAYNIRGAIVSHTDQLRPAIQKGIEALREGRPYLLDIRTKNTGVGAEVSWYPKYSLAGDRSRKV